MDIESTEGDCDHEKAVDALFCNPRKISVAEAQIYLRQFSDPGLYSWWTDDTGARDLSTGNGHEISAGLIYLGQSGAGSGATIASRLLSNHLGGKVRNSTFRLTLCASLIETLELVIIGPRKLNNRSECAITEWMTEHLKVAVYAYRDRTKIEKIEARVLAKLNPPLNIRGMPPSPVRQALTILRSSIRRGPACIDQEGLRTVLPEPVDDNGTSKSNKDSRQPNQLTTGRDIPLADILADYGIVTPEEKRVDGKKFRQQLRACFPDHEHYSRWVFVEGSAQHLKAVKIVEGVLDRTERP